MPVPRWGFVAAAPHQFLLQIRRGEVVTAQQGGSCFRWPSDTVALVDTSVRRLQFTADQVTREKTGVQITGLAVYRVVEPLLAWRMLDLERPELLAELLQQMLLGATRRLVANLTLEECLTRRKDALAAELLAEIAPVVGGSGRPEDGADRGWGVGIDTLEIQDVRVLSEEVFSRLQAPYREQLELAALRARDEVAREAARLEHEAFEAEERRRQQRMQGESARLEAERRRAMDRAVHEAEVAARQQAARLEREQQQAEQEAAQQRARAAARIAEERDAAALRLESARSQAEAERVLGAARAEVERAERAAAESIGEGRLREILLTTTLPEVARAYADSFDRIVVTGATDLSVLGAGVAQVLSTAAALGFSLPGSRPDPG